MGKVYWDKLVRGLHLRVYPKRKVYYLYYRTSEGVERRPKVGDAATISLSQARTVAKKWLAEVTLGGDPSLERQGIRGERTLEQVFTAVATDKYTLKQWERSGYGSEFVRYYQTKIRKRFGGKKLSTITVNMIDNWHKDFESKVSANRAIAVLSKLFTYSERKGWRPPGSNPCRFVDHFEEKSRDRYATANELRSILKILERDYDSKKRLVTYIQTLIATGSRPRALDAVTWDALTEKEYDGEKFGVLQFQGKTGHEKVVIPPKIYKKICYFMRRPGHKIFGVKGLRGYWESVRKEAGCPDLWLRDLRRTYATIGLSSGESIDVIGELLNHKTTQTTKVYARLTNQKRINSAFQIEKEIEALSDKE